MLETARIVSAAAMLRRRGLYGMSRILSAVMVAGLAAIALVAVRAIAFTHTAASEAARTDLAGLEDATELQALLYQKGFVAEYLLTGDTRWLDELGKTTPQFARWLERMSREARSEEASRVANALAEEYGRYDAERTRAIEEFRQGDKDKATATLVGNAERSAHLRELAEQLLHLRRAEVSQKLEHADLAFRQALVGLALSVIVAVIGAAGVGYLFARRVARPLYELVLRAESAGSGTRVEVNADDEIEALAGHVTRLAQQIEASSREIADQRERLHQAEKISALGEMATAVAHEVLNPLTGVKTAMQLLTKLDASAAVKETAAEVDREIDRVDRIAWRLISFARPVKPELREVAIDRLFERVVAATKHEAESRSVEVKAVSDGAASIHGDADLLEQVLINLTLNACQASAKGEAVAIRTRRDGSWLVIEVEDRGSGLAKEVSGHLFTPFVTTKPGGHGLGLAISQNIVVSHGGRIEARSNVPGPGATFSIYLPGGGSS
jgi:signal transduction histidine kinase